ncbi:putative F-box domain-containing protein [Rosellinia necatrix]|uniref:Putative F-box domain-containing protein n=1 Tax=Rosellinia necatrix TaxID=77044 RepID=A0A1S7UPN5_ROSNE|nr:putative F-box domain-containing protein [Rosellinia necatrix]
MDNHSTHPGSAGVSPARASPNHVPGLLDLPSELIDTILSYLTPSGLVGLSLVCRKLLSHATNDIHWQRHVLSNLPGNRIQSPSPCHSWRELFVAHSQHWFLTKYKIWFCDRSLAGQMIIARYDARRGCIEGYQLLATRSRDIGHEPWVADPTVHIHIFEPDVKLHLDKPIIQFNVDSLENLMRISLSSADSTTRAKRRFFPELPMRYTHGSDPRFSTFVLAKPLGMDELAQYMEDRFPYGLVWPPPAIPATHRVLGHPADIAGGPTPDVIGSPRWKPVNRSEVSSFTFRIRQWIELGPPTIGFHIGEEILTYSTLDPYLYTPTPERPWRGIWVGDYSVHGCEFLLINQPDISDEGLREPLVKLGTESDEEFQARFLAQKVYRGRLEAIKLTGDPNVPRGEYTFYANDLGEDGFVGIAQGPQFQGARIVRSRGHVAGVGFSSDNYIESQLILVSHDRLAQYWVDFGHISFFERVDIDRFLIPS